MTLSFFNNERRKVNMNRKQKNQLLQVGITVLSLVGMYLSNRLHDRELQELKDEIKAELLEMKEEE